MDLRRAVEKRCVVCGLMSYFNIQFSETACTTLMCSVVAAGQHSVSLLVLEYSAGTHLRSRQRREREGERERGGKDSSLTRPPL